MANLSTFTPEKKQETIESVISFIAEEYKEDIKSFKTINCTGLLMRSVLYDTINIINERFTGKNTGLMVREEMNVTKELINKEQDGGKMNELQVKLATLDSREVAKMVEKDHPHLLRDIENYLKYLEESQNPKLVSDDFFIQSSYTSGTGKSYKCYQVTKKGCELIAHKMTGQKGVLFTATYIEKFNAMEQQLQQPKDSYMIIDPIERAKAWIREQEDRKILTEKIEEQKHKVLFAEAVENSEDVILVKEMATILCQHGFEIGQNQLYEYLRKHGYLCCKKGDMYNLPTQRYTHLFKVIKRTIQHTEGTEVKNTPKINGKGQIYFIKKFAEYKALGITIKDLFNKSVDEVASSKEEF